MSNDDLPEITNIEPVPEDEKSGPISEPHSGGSSSNYSQSMGMGGKSADTGRHDPLVGKRLKDTYELVKKVGEGGMGHVYKAIQAPLNREVAVKMLKPSEANPEGEHYFLREVQAINMLRHPNIIGIVDFGTEPDGTLFLVMEFLPGVTLKRVIRKQFPVEPKRICRICIQVLSALEQAHQSGVVHCDLKPGNVMLETVAGEEDFVKVLDFGIAKVKGPAMKVGPYTQQGNIVGTFDYMSPEQIMRKELDGRADVWSMGVIVYEMLTRKRIFHDKDAVSIIGRVMQMPIKRPSEVVDPKYNAMIPKVLEDIALKAMERNIDKRYKSAADMRKALTEALRILEGSVSGPLSDSMSRPVVHDLGNDPSGPISAPLPKSDPLSQSWRGDGLGNSLSESGLVKGPDAVTGRAFGDTGRTGMSAIQSRSGTFGLGDSQRLATGIAAGTSILDQTFSVEELQSTLTGERRKVAVLAIQQRAQARKGVDPEEIARRSSEEVAIIREVVDHFDGKIDSFLGGTYTILFGAKQAKVGDSVRAIECALALQQKFRDRASGADHIGLGVTYGEIYLSDKKGGNAFGGSIDMAVEIARASKDANVYIDAELHEITREQASFGKSMRVNGEETYEVASISAVKAEVDASPLEKVEVFIPRTELFNEISRRAMSAKQNRGGGVAILGDIGSGKTTLLKRSVIDLKKSGFNVFSLEPSDVDARQSLSAIRAWIRKIAATYKDPPTLIRKAAESMQVREGLDAIVRLYISNNWDSELAKQLPWADNESFAHFTSALFHRMIRFAMKSGPVLLVSDDFSLSDKATFEVIDGLLEVIQSQPVLLVVTKRFDASTERDHGLPGNFETMQIGGFNPDQSRQFIIQTLGYTPPLEVVEQLHKKSGGNPTFLSEMVQKLRRTSTTQVLNADVLNQLVPLSLHELLAQKVDGLPPNLRDLLAIASVLGESFREEFFFQIAPAHLGPALALPELVRMGLLEAQYDHFGRVHVGFNPRALRQVVYSRLPNQSKREFHARVIEFLEAAPQLAAVDPLDWSMSLAFHYRAVEGWEGAAYYLSRASDVLLDLYDYPAAIAQYEAAEKMLRENGFRYDTPTTAEILAKLLAALRESGRLEEATHYLINTRVDKIPIEFRGKILLEKGRLGGKGVPMDDAMEALEEVRTIALHHQSLKTEVQALLTMSELFQTKNQLSHAGSLLMEVAQKVEQIPSLNLHDAEDRKLFWTAYNQLGTLFIRQNNVNEAQKYLNIALQRARDISDSRGVVRVLSNLGALCLMIRDVNSAMDYFSQALQFARGIGDLLNQTKILTNLGVATMESNDFESSKVYFKEARTLAEEIGWHEGLADIALHIKKLRAAIGA